MFLWASVSDGAIPDGAVVGGQDQDGGPIYVGRAFHAGDLLPAKICPTHSCAFVSFNGQEITKTNYEVLISSQTAWRSAQGHAIPSEAVKVGQTADGEPLYIGRVLHNGTLTVGKVHPSHGVLYISWAGQEQAYRDYEILVLH